jgi:hypothetical protein
VLIADSFAEWLTVVENQSDANQQSAISIQQSAIGNRQ